MLSVPLNDHMGLMHPGCGFPEGHSNCGRIAGNNTEWTIILDAWGEIDQDLLSQNSLAEFFGGKMPVKD